VTICKVGSPPSSITWRGDNILFSVLGSGTLARAGIPERVSMKLTGHKTRSIFERYNIVSDGDLAGAAEKLNKVSISNVLVAEPARTCR
jgi:hypothetical protein